MGDYINYIKLFPGNPTVLVCHTKDGYKIKSFFSGTRSQPKEGVLGRKSHWNLGVIRADTKGQKLWLGPSNHYHFDADNIHDPKARIMTRAIQTKLWPEKLGSQKESPSEKIHPK